MNMLKTGFALSMIFFLSACASDVSKTSISSGNEAWHLSVSGKPQLLTVVAKKKNEVFRKISVVDSKGVAAQISCLFEAPTRLSFFAVLPNAQEIWEMSYDPSADPIFPGFVHNYRTGQVEGITVEEQPFARRRLYLGLDHNTLTFSPSHTEVIGYGEDGSITVYNLDSRKPAGKLTDQINVSLLDSQFAIVDDELIFILNLPDGRQQIFSTHSWREIEGKTVAASTLVAVDICTKK
jgi:dihydro-heme d1 dehydrogenase